MNVAEKKTQNLKKPCRCIVRHALTKVERKEVVNNFDRARRLNDSVGMMIAMAQLGKCSGT